MPIESLDRRRHPPTGVVRFVVLAVAFALVAVATISYFAADQVKSHTRVAVPAQKTEGVPVGEFVITDLQRRGLTVEPVQIARFVPTRKAEGKIAINENKSTPVFSQYSSARVIKTFANSGDFVEKGAPLARIETPDLVQAANDLTATAASLDKARSQVGHTMTIENRLRDLYGVKAAALKDWQQAQADLNSARDDQRIGEIALAAVRNRLAILGKSPKEIASLESRQAVDAGADIVAPISGFVVQRKVGPGQYVNANATEPLFALGDLSTVWLFASITETDVPYVKVGQQISVRALTYPDRDFAAEVVAVGSIIDPTTRRLQVRAEVENPGNMLKPEMFAEFSITTGLAMDSIAVPADGVIHEGDTARVWVQIADNLFAPRPVNIGIQDRRLVQILSGLQIGDRIVSKGCLFIDRASQLD